MGINNIPYVEMELPYVTLEIVMAN